jgi:nucleotide-binding universal stress UspA family protein
MMIPESDIRQAREDAVRRYLAESMGAADTWTLDVRLGQTAREIRDVAREIDASAIVMGAAPHRLFGHMVAGARAAQVLRGAPCPVLSVSPALSELPRRVVAAVDFSPASIRAVQAALFLVGAEATLTLVHVAVTQELGRSAFRPARPEPDSYASTRFDRLREQLAPYTPSGVVLDTRLIQGGVAQEVLEYARWLGADLVAVGTHGPGFVERMFLGSTASNILHLAPCTVLASPAPSPAEAIDLALRVSGTAMTAKPEDWPELLDAVSRRDAGRLVTVEVDDRDFGAQIEASGYLLRGITFDPHDRRVALMLEAPQGGGAHLTRSIPNVDSIAIVTGPDGRDRALAIRHGRGQTLLLMTS